MTHAQAKERAKALVAQMTVEEKISQLLYTAPAIERLGIKPHNWWNEASHGVARAGTATVFPHAIAMAATFDPETVKTVADVISTEGRIKYNKHVAHDDYDIFKGMTYWAPNINIFRDPRWGRGQETFGEDPYLSATLGAAFIKGLQGEGEFLKASACSKHFAVHSGPEKQRHEFDAVATMKDMWETYLPAFEHTVKAGVTGVMGAYNRTNGVPCCAHQYLLKDILRDTWDFDGYVVSDCGAIKDIYKHHQYTDTPAEAAAVALKAGCDLNCGKVYQSLIDAYEEDLVTEEEITVAAERLFTIRYRLGEFEDVRPYADLPYDLLDCKAHRALNEKVAADSIVLLKNENGFLPLSPKTTQKIAVDKDFTLLASFDGKTAIRPLAGEKAYGKGRSIYVSFQSNDPEYDDLVKRAIFRAAGREKDLFRLYSTNPVVMPYAYGTENIFVLNNDGKKRQTTTLKMDLKLFAGSPAKVRVKNIIDNKVIGTYTAADFAKGVEFTIDGNCAEYFMLEKEQ